MKEYSLDIKHMSTVRRLFQGYIFRREEDGVGYVKCTDKHATYIAANGIELTLVEDEKE